MILVDTSVWVDHLRHKDAELDELVQQSQVLCHPFVIGELALGRHREQDQILEDLSEFPQAQVARNEEVLFLIRSEKMQGRGVGYVDAHLLTSVRMSPGLLLWTRDKRLDELALSLGVSYRERRVH